MKKLFSILSLIAIITVIIVACKDNFNESDFLTLQAKLKSQQDSAKLNQQVKQMNAAGSLLSFTVQVAEDGNPLSGVDVQVSNDITAGSSKVTTDANGNAIFTKASVGNNTITLSKSGYTSAIAVVDFGRLSDYYTIVQGASGANIIPLKQSRAVLLPLFSTGGSGSTATVQGKVTIETDVTNTTPEVPQNLTIRANYAEGIASAISGNTGVTVVSYAFNQAGVGVASVNNSTGLYSMKVPASAAGIKMSLLLPTIDADQRIAVINLDGKPIATGPQYRNVPTAFGPTLEYDASIPSVAGAKVNFSPAPVSPGNGVKFNFTVVPRTLVASFGLWTMNHDSNFGGGQLGDGPEYAFQAGATQWQLTNRGAGYTSSPAVVVSGGGASSDAKMSASLGGILKSITLTAGGSGYSGTTATVTMRYKDAIGNNVTIGSFSAPMTVTAGVITAISFPANIATINGLDPTSPFHTNYYGNIQSFDAVISSGGGTGATISSTYANFVDGIKVTSAGAGYTSAPTITFSGGALPLKLYYPF